ncbi:hypothetical protein FF38_05346 [Lucilia cuprina]|uniref:Uncharacterized protein n=1 Tax=Lucilia cuprina TaxID=7375 RepID=A0A0L0BNE2_LUCCU|nr:hypothetical protein FF38_05346 [Lucilia cuprina]
MDLLLVGINAMYEVIKSNSTLPSEYHLTIVANLSCVECIRALMNMLSFATFLWATLVSEVAYFIRCKQGNGRCLHVFVTNAVFTLSLFTTKFDGICDSVTLSTILFYFISICDAFFIYIIKQKEDHTPLFFEAASKKAKNGDNALSMGLLEMQCGQMIL